MSLELRFNVPGQSEQVIPFNQNRMIVGTLLSNQVVLRVPGVEPIHAMFEELDDGSWAIVDLGSQEGVVVNGQKVDVETTIRAGDVVRIGGVDLTLGHGQATAVAQVANQAEADTEIMSAAAGAAVPPSPKPSASPGATPIEPATPKAKTAPHADRGRRKDVLFSPRKARPAGDVLEVVAYWGDTVLEVDHFHPSIKGFEEVTIGDPTKAHLIAAGKSHLSSFPLASVGDRGFSLRMMDGMDARLRKDGKVEKLSGKNKVSLGRRDIAQVKYGAVRYFMLFVKPPSINLPKMGPKDPFFLALISMSLLFYMLLVPAIWFANPEKEEKDKDDIWAIVNVPEKAKPKPKPKPKPKVIAKVKKPPPPRETPPKPQPKPPKPAKAIEKEKPKQRKPVEKPVVKPKKNNLASLKKPKVQKKKTAGDLSKLKKASSGTPSTGAKNPDFKLAGPKNKAKAGPAGGSRGAGMSKRGGARKGKSNASVRGVEGPKNNKASGPNLAKLGVGPGKILSKIGPGAQYTNFKSDVGGAGGGLGSASRTTGLGGVGKGSSLNIQGVDSGLNNFGSGAGGLGSGRGGSGGLGGRGLGKAFGGGRGRGRANVTVPSGDPVVSGGLTPQEIDAVIRANLNQIRHCYEKLLQRSPNSAGKVGVRFVVGTSGRVNSASVTNSSIADAKMRGCVTGRIKRWKFPKPRGGKAVTVNYPFVFNPL